MSKRLGHKLGYSLGRGLSYGSAGSREWTAPFKSDALVWLDGTILDVTGTKYFVDKISGKNFLITGYDFDSTWLKGFPYKSAATISAPAGFAALIAKDTNYFWYDSGGTPNQVPVISLFQDIDYEHIFFCRHLAQRVDGNGVETYEPRVSDIVLYNTVKSDADLTKCQTEFSVPTENASAKWVSKAGNDTTGTGTKAAPYLTIEKAYKTVASGSEIYVKTGVFTEEYNGTSIRYFYADRAGTWTISALGLTEIRTISTALVIQHVGSTMIWNRMIFNGETNTTSVISFFSASSNSGTFNKCKIVGAATNSIFTQSGVGVNNCECYDCIIPEFKAITLYDTGIIKRSLVNCTTLFITTGGVYEYNKHTYSTYSASPVVKNALSVKFNKIKTKSIAVSFDLATNPTISYNNLEFVWTASLATSLQFIYIGATNSCTPTISHNKIFSNSLLISDAIQFIYLNLVTLPVIEYNNMYSASKTNVSHLTFNVGASVIGKASIKGNRFHSNTQGGFCVSLGGESLFHNKMDETEILYNSFAGSLLEYPNEDPGGAHFLMANSGIDLNIRYNLISYTDLALVVKTGDVAQAYTKNGVGNNVFINNKIDIWVRGVTDLLIYNNSHNVNSAFSVGARVQVDENSAIAGNQFSERVLIKNSILNKPETATNIYMAYFDAHAAANGCKLVNCIINNENASNKLIYDGATTYTTLAASDAAGLTENCIESDPLYTDVANNILTVLSNSPAIGNGETLDAAYDDGLDASSSWGTDSQLPSVVTKQQGASWDIGAYVH